jgi:hypothetical protein
MRYRKGANEGENIQARQATNYPAGDLTSLRQSLGGQEAKDGTRP